MDNDFCIFVIELKIELKIFEIYQKIKIIYICSFLI